MGNWLQVSGECEERISDSVAPEHLRGSWHAPTLLCAAAWDPNRPHTQAAATAVGACQYRDLPDDEADWATTLFEFFGH